MVGRRRMKIPKSFLAIIPLKVIMSVVTTLVVLLIIAIGGGAAEVGIVMSLLTIGNLLGSLIWAKALSKTRKYITGYIGGYAGMFLALLILLKGDYPSIYLSSFLITFLSNLTYLAAMFLISENYEDRVNEMIGIFEMVGGWAWVAGLGIGAIAIGLINAPIFITYLSLLSLVAIVLTSILLGASISKRFIEGIKKDFGLLPLLDKSLNKIIEYEECVTDIVVKGVHEVFSGSIMQFPIYYELKLPSKERLTFYIPIFLQFLSFGLVYSQIIKFLNDIGYTGTIIYLISLLSSMISAMAYPMVGKVKNMLKMLIAMSVVRVLLFILLISIFYIPPYLVTPIIVIFSLLDGFSWAYIYVLLNLVALKISREEVGISNFIRSIGYILGAIISGIIISIFSYQINFALAMAILSVSIVIYSKVKIS